MAKYKVAMGDQLYNHRSGFDKNMESMETAHFHNNYEIYYLERTNSKVSYLIDRNIYTVGEGSLVLVPPQSLHRLMYTDFNNNYFSRYLLSFGDAFVPADLVSAFDIHHYQLSDEDKETVSLIMKNIGEEYALFDKFFTRMYKQYLSSLLVLLVRKYSRP
ncbi:MAG: AraC family ligand binding domain-containing protein, partial [Clostridia bacterium]|nr:AraC family ligand binding domain-containing protein [Clostridia bacterium]